MKSVRFIHFRTKTPYILACRGVGASFLACTLFKWPLKSIRKESSKAEQNKLSDVYTNTAGCV